MTNINWIAVYQFEEIFDFYLTALNYTIDTCCLLLCLEDNEMIGLIAHSCLSSFNTKCVGVQLFQLSFPPEMRACRKIELKSTK